MARRTANQLVVFFALILIILVISSACGSARTAPVAPTEIIVPPVGRYDDFIARQEPVGKHFEAQGADCGGLYINGVPIHFCEDPSYPNFYVAYATCGEEVLGEAHRIYRPEGTLFPDYRWMQVFLFAGQNGGTARGALGQKPRLEMEENDNKIVRLTFRLPLEGGGEAVLVVHEPEDRCDRPEAIPSLLSNARADRSVRAKHF
ncbi:hypothetical protein HY504_01270 [Candidatus Wolfebacteria bacterium]|nr:hypothetical protein [Candidatus Wolfebacteria bacterium]